MPTPAPSAPGARRAASSRSAPGRGAAATASRAAKSAPNSAASSAAGASRSAVLLWCIGRQREGWLKATHKKIANTLGVERSNVTRAIGRLEEWHMIQRVDTGLISVNPMLGFEGNGDRQREILDALRDADGKLPEGVFPALNAPQPPRGVQLELGAEDGEDEVVDAEARAC